MSLYVYGLLQYIFGVFRKNNDNTGIFSLWKFSSISEISQRGFCELGEKWNFVQRLRSVWLSIHRICSILIWIISTQNNALDCRQHYCNVQQVSLKSSLVTTFSLLRWSFEICNALKYLASIGVVHAGICTKNIYLTEDKVAKISIPALPSQLHRYSSYDASEEVSVIDLWVYLHQNTSCEWQLKIKMVWLAKFLALDVDRVVAWHDFYDAFRCLDDWYHNLWNFYTGISPISWLIMDSGFCKLFDTRSQNEQTCIRSA